MVGGVVGIGIFLTPVEMARSLGAPGFVFGMWLLAGAMAACGALCYGELSARFPAAGGPYVYLREAYGPPVAFLYGWKCLLVMDPGLSASVATGAAEYGSFLFGLEPLGARAFALCVVLALATLTALGTRLASSVVLAITAAKVALLLAIVAWGFGSGTAEPHALRPLFERAPDAAPLAAGLAGGFVAAFFSFGGWWEASKLAGEVRDPRRSLPFVFLLGVGIVTLLYLLASAVFLAVAPAAREGAAAVTAPLLGEALFGATGGRVMAALVLVSAVGSLAAVMLSAPRLYVAMAKDGLFPRALGRRHPRLGTPLAAIAVQAALACALVVWGSFGEILAYFMFATVLFITLSVAALFALPPPPAGSFRAPWRLAAALGFVAPACVLLLLLLLGSPRSAGLGAAVVALGLPVYFLLRRRAQGDEAKPTEP